MSGWHPQPAALQEILQTIVASTDHQNTAVQKEITTKLNNFTQVPAYIAYLAFIMSSDEQPDDKIRQIAGYLLKNNAKLILTESPDVVAFTKAAILHAFNHQSALLRKAAEPAVVAFLGMLEPVNWQDCMESLVMGIDGGDLDRQELAFNVLEKACEDYPRKLEISVKGTDYLAFLVPRIISLTEHPEPRMRAHAVACLGYFAAASNATLFANIDIFIAALFKRASDVDGAVRRHVCTSLSSLLVSRPDKLIPEMNNVAEYMLYSTKDKNEGVALEACEFWLTFAEDAELSQFLVPLLDKVAPVLLDCMVYGEDDLLWLESDLEDADVPDNPQDIKPKHFGSKSHSMERDPSDASERSEVKRGMYGEDLSDPNGDDDDFDDDEDDDDFANEMSTEWNLRKCAAAALDVLAVRHSNLLLQSLLPSLQTKLASTEWLDREAGILALGAIAEGCIECLEDHLSQLIPFLIQTLNDTKPLVRSITCWTLGRYASWCTQPISEEHKQKYFIPAMEGLLRMVLDNNKRVQEAGCSAFATLEEDAGTAMIPFLEPVLRNLVFAFNKYQHKNMLILYDAVGTLADAVGRALSNPTLVEILMPPLTARWGKFEDDDENLIPLLECLASVTISMGASFGPYVAPVFERCNRIIHQSLLAYQQYQQNPDLDEPEKAFLVVSLDLLSGLVQGIGQALEPMIQATNPNILALLTVCLKVPYANVRQSAYALVGDLAMNCFDGLRPHMVGIMPELIIQLDSELRLEFLSATNNAAWSVGEVALRYGRDDQEFRQWTPSLLNRLVAILLHQKTPRSLNENCAVTIGRIALVQPEIVAPHLPEFAVAWCQALYEVRDNEEKDSSFRGVCLLVQHNPAGMAKSLLWFCNAIVRWNNPSPELNSMFQQLLNGFKNHDTAAWAQQVAAFPPTIQERLAARYGV